jgi:hypothetical protein
MKIAFALFLAAIGGVLWYAAHVTDTDAWVDGGSRRVGR